MADTAKGLVNGGRTSYFTFQYDDMLSKARGVDVTNDLMRFCDADLDWLAAWFPGTSLNLPINVTVASPTPGGTFGGSWGGWGFIPFNVTLTIGEGDVMGTSPSGLLRYLLISEVSEMFMRDGGTSWFASLDEGSMGEGLSRFLAAEFLLQRVTATTMVPDLIMDPVTHEMGTWRCAQDWLNSSRNNFVDRNDDDIQPDEKTGCSLLFINFLHYQLGTPIRQIIAARGDKLAAIYAALTGDKQANAWPAFKNLVDAHCPQGNGTSFDPAFDNIFPLPDLAYFGAPATITWVSTPVPARASIGLTCDALIEIGIMTSSDAPGAVGLDDPVIFPAGRHSARVPLMVTQNVRTPQDVTLAASFAGISMTAKVRVVSPENYPMPKLAVALIAPEDADPCAQVLVEGTSATFGVTNLMDVFDSSAGLTYRWTVIGAAAGATSGPTLTIQSLPPAGTKVSVSVKVSNPDQLNASSDPYAFASGAALTGIAELQREVMCRIHHIKNINQIVQPGVPVENPISILTNEQLQTVEAQAARVVREAERVIVAVKMIAVLKAKQRKS